MAVWKAAFNRDDVTEHALVAASLRQQNNFQQLLNKQTQKQKRNTILPFFFGNDACQVPMQLSSLPGCSPSSIHTMPSKLGIVKTRKLS